MQFQHDYDRPLSTSERVSSLVFLLVVLGLFGASLVVEYEPVKLSAVFFVAFWAPLLVLHELGHALMAQALGWRVVLVSIGMGRRVLRCKVGALLVDVRMYPLEGFVLPVPTRLRNPRLENALIYFAGPGIEMLLLGLVVLVVGPSTLTTRSESIAIIAAQSFALAIVVGLVFNLVPHAVMTNHGAIVNDGLGILRSASLPDSHFQELMEHDWDVDHLWASDEPEED